MSNSVFSYLWKPRTPLRLEPAISAGVHAGSAGYSGSPAPLPKPWYEDPLREYERAMKAAEEICSSKHVQSSLNSTKSINDQDYTLEVHTKDGEITMIKTVVKSGRETEEKKPSVTEPLAGSSSLKRSKSIDRTQFPPYGISKPTKVESVIFPGRTTKRI